MNGIIVLLIVLRSYGGLCGMMKLNGKMLYLTIEGDAFKSKVIAREDTKLLIDYPVNIETKRTAFLMDETMIEASFTTEGANKQTYMFTSTVLGRVKDQVPLLVIHYPGDKQLQKLQRRAFVRVDALLDIALKHPTGNYPVVTKDISAGGLAFYLPKNLQLEAEERIPMIIVLPVNDQENEYVNVEARVVRTEDGIGFMEYTDITSIQRQQLVQFCFRRQLKMKRSEVEPTD